MKTIKYYFFFLMLFLSAACSDDDRCLPFEDDGQLPSYQNSLLEDSIAQKEFAIILSKAVYSNEKLREFIKKQALKQFDKDYDVFYPYIKDLNVDGEKSFRDVLLDYTSDENLKIIEKSLPLLNIFVPDLSFVGGFDVRKWNTSRSDVLVSYREGNQNSVFFENGDVIFSLEDNELPTFPFLVVKNNERMRVKNSMTRACGQRCDYEFIDDAFNGGIDKYMTRGYTEYDVTFPSNKEDDNNAYVNDVDISQKLIDAYEKYRNSSGFIYRDYMYYNMSPDNTNNGVLQRNVKERLYAFRVEPSAIMSISDDFTNSNKDPQLYETPSKQKREFTYEELCDAIWKEGNFEFRLNLYMGGKDMSAAPCDIMLNLAPDSLFRLESAHIKKKHSTAFRHSHYHYFVKSANFSSKWVNLSNKKYFINSDTWDISKNATKIFLEIEECDPSEIDDREFEIKTTYSDNSGFSSEDNNIKTSLGVASSQEVTEKIKITTTKQSDMVGKFFILYTDPVILGKDSNKNRYRVHSYYNGYVELIILPYVIE